VDQRTPDYYRRRADAATDRRLDRLEAKVDALSNRLAWIAGGLAVLSIVANVVGPLVVERILR
jgi:hypothetical protein